MVEGLYTVNNSTLLQFGDLVTSTRDNKFRDAGVLKEKLLIKVGWSKVAFKQLVIWDD